MDKLLTFLADYYVWFLIGAGVVLLALIGFIVDSKKKNNEIKTNDFGTYASSEEESFFKTPENKNIEPEKTSFKAQASGYSNNPTVTEPINQSDNNIESVDLFANSTNTQPLTDQPINEVVFEPKNEVYNEPVITTESFANEDNKSNDAENITNFSDVNNNF